MSFLDVLEKAAEVPETVLIKFFYHYKVSGNTLHFFYEGLDDQSFYGNYIQSIYQLDWKFYHYVCDGKHNVYDTYRSINWEKFNKSRVLFFTDKDLDDILGIDNIKDYNIYETKFYSIENYVVNSEVYKRFLREICYITNDKLIDELCNKFDEQLKLFQLKMKSLSAWVVYCRANKLKVNLSDIDIDKIFMIDSGFNLIRRVSKPYSSPFQYVCASTKTQFYCLTDIKRIMAQLATINPPKMYIRGKYEMWFFYAFCENTIRTTIPLINKEVKAFNKKADKKATKSKVTISIKPENILQIAAPRVRIPVDLLEFLRTNYYRLN
jgi:hypothetical protein